MGPLLKTSFFSVVLLLTGLGIARGEEPRPDGAFYEERTKDPILEKIKDRKEALDKQLRKETEEITAPIKKARKEKKENRPVLLSSLPADERPEGPKVFKSVFHFEPQAQFYTGTCWAFAGTSFLESEVYRIKGKKVKLAEMHTVYWEYVEKARRFVQMRGESDFSEGSQVNAVNRMWAKYGVVPLSVYDGVVAEDGLHDHLRMYDELNAFLKYIETEQIWDEDFVVSGIRLILDKYLGTPPQEFEFEGKRYTPVSFLREALGINPDDYVQFMSTKQLPFYQTGLFDVPDNWWKDDTYYNVPLEDFMGVVDGAILNGYSVGIGGDVSEPGKNFHLDIAFIPTFDIPFEFIDQDARELRIYNHTTTDDHGIHLVGVTKVAGKKWYLIKDSGRSARHGRFDGYYFFREDFIKLKMLTVLVHKDSAKKLIEKCKARKAE